MRICFKLRKFFFVVQYIVVLLQKPNFYMKKVFYILTIVAALTSCAESYNIKGTSSLSLLDGSKLYLKVMQGEKLTNFDSCEVVHGDFKFCGELDTTCIAGLFMDDQSIMPVVIEKGDINIMIDETKQKVSGSPLNDRLYEFLEQHNQLTGRMVELGHRDAQMLLDGIDESVIAQEIGRERMKIISEEDSLVTDFVVNNFDNILGPYIFVRNCSSVPQIEHIMSKATDHFKNDPQVQAFYEAVTKSNSPELANETMPEEPSDEEVSKILEGE